MQIICKSHTALLFYNLDVPLGKMLMETSGRGKPPLLISRSLALINKYFPGSVGLQ